MSLRAYVKGVSKMQAQSARRDRRGGFLVQWPRRRQGTVGDMSSGFGRSTGDVRKGRLASAVPLLPA